MVGCLACGLRRVLSPVTATPIIETFTLGPWATNCYLVHGGARTHGHPASCWIADVSFEPDDLIDRVRALSLKPEAVVLTHAHVDHIAGVAEFVRAFPGTPVWIHEAEQDWLSIPMLNLSAAAGVPVTSPGPNRLLHDGDSLSLAGETWEVRHTPGHSPGSIALIHAMTRRAITGDALFAGSVGRTDFPGCDSRVLERSIRTQLYTLGDDVTFFPGHGSTSTIGRERKSNPYVQG